MVSRKTRFLSFFLLCMSVYWLFLIGWLLSWHQDGCYCSCRHQLLKKIRTDRSNLTSSFYRNGDESQRSHSLTPVELGLIWSLPALCLRAAPDLRPPTDVSIAFPGVNPHFSVHLLLLCQPEIWAWCQELMLFVGLYQLGSTCSTLTKDLELREMDQGLGRLVVSPQ